MKKRILTFLLSAATVLSAAATAVSTRNSVLSSGTWVKIRVSESGVYTLTYEQLAEAGLANPSEVRIYGYGGAQLSQRFADHIDDLPAVPLYMHTGSDGIFGKGDYILFYAEGPLSVQYNGLRAGHTRNTYSSYGYYFVTTDGGEKHRMDPSPYSAPNGADTTRTCVQIWAMDNDSVNLVDPTGHEGGGRTWFGEKMTVKRNTLRFSAPTHHLTGDKITVRYHLGGKSTKSATVRCTTGQTTATGTIRAIATTNYYQMADTVLVKHNAVPDGTGAQAITIVYNSDDESAAAYLNWIEMEAPARLTMDGNWMPIFLSGPERDEIAELSEADASVQIWDITRRDSIRAVPSEYMDGRVRWTLPANRDASIYAAVHTDRQTGLTPVIVGRVANQNLHREENIDMVIISDEDLIDAARRLAEAHESDGLTTLVVTDDEVYNEFSSGTPDATAYRRLMKMLYDRADGSVLAPQFLLLMGDGSFDNRALNGFSGNHNLLTYQAKNSINEVEAYASDDYFGYLDDNSGNDDRIDKMRIGVGRIPASTPEEAEAAVSKTLRYMADGHKGKWKQQIAVLSDDGDSGLHLDVAEAGAEPMRVNNPAFVVNKIYLDAFVQVSTASGEQYPMAQQKLDNLLQSGVLFFDYSGHGSYNNITSEGVMNRQSIADMTNENLGLWMMATCNFGHFDANHTSAAETAMLNPNGGAIGVLSSNRTVYAHLNDIINRQICTALFRHDSPCGYDATPGRAVMEAKNGSGTNINKLSYTLLGDPAVRIPFPSRYRIVVDSASAPDTVRALTVHTVRGYIADDAGDTISGFNGPLNVTIYDKLQRVTTLDNDKDGSTRTYNDYPNRLFSGEAAVRDGHFSFEFMAPKDIHYNYGNGRMVFYALDSVLNAESVGYYEDFLIGGSSPVEISHETGPEMTLYLNNELWTDGSRTHPKPHFYARLYDEYGINTVGSGIGHDLLLTVDGDAQQTYVLNDSYESSEGTYTRGRVSYPMAVQSPGRHSLTFRAWDLLNNSTTGSLHYEVVDGLEPQIFRVMTYPNPVAQSGLFTLCVDHDRPDDVEKTEVLLYNTSGQLITRLSRRGCEPLSLCPADLGLACGIYIYKVILTEYTGATSASLAGKMIVNGN